ncbi:MAG: hypothetical protein JO325_10125, partial [Solirubrobacterales bacterium]|nr:hypothetical protein [Solirubrobacterales bacterium]
GPALGFLAVAGALGAPEAVAGASGAHEAVAGALGAPEAAEVTPSRPSRTARAGAPVAALAAGGLALVAAVVVLGFPYLSVREVSVASDLRQTDPTGALSDLGTAADLNPLSADPGRLGGTIALTTGQYASAQRRFDQAIARDPGGWYGWLGAGLAASGSGNRALARHDLETARSINRREPVIRMALDRVDTTHPLPPIVAIQDLAAEMSS